MRDLSQTGLHSNHTPVRFKIGSVTTIEQTVLNHSRQLGESLNAERRYINLAAQNVTECAIEKNT